MAHQLRIVTENATLSVRFTEDLESQVEVLLREAAGLPPRWGTTRYETDSAGLTWSAGGSRDQVIAFLDCCRQHGWPFVVYVSARHNDDSLVWPRNYAATYLGWWPNRHAFAQEIAASRAHFVEEDTAAKLDQDDVAEICSGFLCLDVDGQVVVFDEHPNR